MTQTAADICRERGWGKGTLLLVHRSPWDFVFRVTAVGEDGILCREVASRYRDNEWKEQEGFENRVLRFTELYVAEHGGSVTAIDRLPWEVPDATA